MFTRITSIVSVCAIAGGLLASCGGGDGNDEDFVRGLCESSTELRVGIEQAVKDAASSTDPNRAVEALVEPIDEFVEAFGDLKPPKDLKDWHNDAEDTLEQIADNFREQKALAALEGFSDSPVPDPPAAAKQRLRVAAEDIQACNGVTFLKPD